MRNTGRAILSSALLLALLGSLSLASSQEPSSPQPWIPGLGQESEESLQETLNQVKPQVYADSAGYIYRLWVDYGAGQGHHIRFQRSADAGKSWLPAPLVLDRDKPGGARSTAPDFTRDASGRLMAIWRTKYREGGGKKDILFLSSPDRGVTWPGPARTLNRGGSAFSGKISADGQGQVYVVWYDERRSVGRRGGTRSGRGLAIFFNRSEDFGKTWLVEDIQLSGLATTETTEPKAGEKKRPAFISAQPRIQSDGQGRVFVAWVDNREGRTEIYFRASQDHGKSWGPETNLSRRASSATNHQLLTDGQGRVFVVWSDARHGFEDIFFARSEDGGKQWAEPTRLSRRPAGVTISTRPHMALGSRGEVYVAWQDRRNGREDIYFNASWDGGKSWLDKDVRLDRDDAGTGVSREPYVLAHPNGRVTVLWEDDRSGFEQILLNWSADRGRSWLEREIRVDVSTGPKERARQPKAAWDPAGNLHVAWEVWKGWGQQVEQGVEYQKISLTP